MDYTQVTYKAAKDWNSIQNKISFNFTEDYLSWTEKITKGI